MTRTDEHLSDEQLWGKRPVSWGFRMLGSDPLAMVQSLSPSEQREAADFLGSDLRVDVENREDVVRFTTKITEHHRVISSSIDTDATLYANLHGLQGALGLDDVDLDLIAFRAMLRLHPGFEALAGKYVGLCCDFVFHRRLAYLFDRPESAITGALAPSSRLVKSGLVNVISGVLGTLERRLSLLGGLISPLVASPASPSELLKQILPTPRKSHLDLTAYPHLAREAELLAKHLRESLDAHNQGINVLLRGMPGTGKTELAAALAESLHCPLYPSEPAPEDGESLTPRDRFQHLIQLQKLARITGTGLVLVDEAEDLFPTIWSDSEKTPTKAAINECLETNPTPTIWISNRTEHMDEAFLRRFDLVIHVPPLPASAKRSLLENALPLGVLDERDLRRYAHQRELSPAMITRMARVATCGGSQDARTVRANMEVVSSHYLKTLGVIPPADNSAPALLKHDPRLLNSDPPLDDVVQAMRAACFGTRMLLHGLPGTGKTAFCKALAETLDKTLLQRQASSLLSCYLGETEKNLRDMFDEAQRENAVLLLDEADSFLRSRDGARARWEVTQTNELLTQLEAFDGIFICTTNRLGDLDPAALRRFDFKVEFQPLRPEQRVHLIRECCALLGLGAYDGEASSFNTQRLDGLTPGDAATALRRLRLSASKPNITMLIDALATECRYKPEAPKPIGFLQ